MDRHIHKWDAIRTKKMRIRKRILGTDERPRLSIYRSERHIYGQIINDISGTTLAASSSMGKDLRSRTGELSPTDVAKLVGETLAEKAVAGGITQVVFDRNGRRYGGRLQAFAEGARSKGLLF